MGLTLIRTSAIPEMVASVDLLYRVKLFFIRFQKLEVSKEVSHLANKWKVVHLSVFYNREVKNY